MTGTPLDGIRLVATDLDGTLLNRSGRVGERVRASVELARQNGVETVYLTGRPLHDAASVLGEAGLGGYLAASNGAVVRDRQGLVLGRWTMDAELGAEISAALRLALDGTHLGAVTEGELALDHGFPADLAETWRAQLGERTVEGLLAGGRVLKLLAACPGWPVGAFAEMVSALVGDRFCVTFSTERFLEISLSSATKGAALEVIARAAGVPLSAAACVGDMPNDLGMFDVAGLAVAVANAAPTVRRRAHLVVSSNEDDGVAELIEAIVRARGRNGAARTTS
ncbi:sugar phosphate phosphatase [Longimycelium tulufanense]|uniref:Sugar phosphate phosphatase n=1 Tax=Longimycelium tulufanense TaxID=907463 RepID=A0A8J3CEB4_9PSEU|nr:HAD-IIB family hydrolase [Longimycelium tulufanense]GGM54091.1 sugar phosphate phosphatase [Longimycelium tulufanense]